ncbi:DUF2946 domain-containing protein [Noviherbaspirillum aridicola]|nr:DUF2946 domain-containing protein [Noviherbaspirillum aridicola]
MACMVIALSSLLPMISHAMAAHRAALTAQHEICTAAGVVTVDVPVPDDGPSSHGKHGHSTDCPYCRLHADHPALPPSVPAALPVSPQRAAYPPLFYSSPHPLHAWAFAHPRAPPRFS